MRNYRSLSLIALITWVGLIGYTIIDASGKFGSDVGIVQSLQTSNLARVMFMDIGVLSTIAAGWIAFATKYKLRYFFAILSMFVGSFAILPYLAYHFYRIDKANINPSAV